MHVDLQQGFGQPGNLDILAFVGMFNPTLKIPIAFLKFLNPPVKLVDLCPQGLVFVVLEGGCLRVLPVNIGERNVRRFFGRGRFFFRSRLFCRGRSFRRGGAFCRGRSFCRGGAFRRGTP